MTQSIVNGLVFGGEVSFNPRQVSLDAGGILRVGQQTTLFDGKILNADDTMLWQTVGTGTGSYSGNKFNMSVAPGQWLVRQSVRRFPYFSGKSQRVEATFDGFAPDANVVKRVGYFSSNAVTPYDTDLDGFWLESNGSSINLNSYRFGTPTLNALDITAWSGYDNLGEYKLLSTWDNFTVDEFKFLWLGGAVLAMSLKTSDGFVEAHRFDYAGTASDLFIGSPNQPMRYEIRSTTGTGSLRYICSQVATEGSIDESGKGLGVFNSSAIAANAIGTIYALMGFKKSTTYRDNATQIIDIAVANTTNTTDSGILMLVINPTLSAPLTYGNVSRLQVAYATTQTLTAGTGRVIAATPSGGQGTFIPLSRNFLAWLSSAIDNTHDEYVLAYLSTTANQDVYGIANLKEY